MPQFALSNSYNLHVNLARVGQIQEDRIRAFNAQRDNI